MFFARASLTSLCLLASCTAAQPPPRGAPPRSEVTAASPSEDPPPPALRLPRAVRPTRYAAELQVDPDAERFQGTLTVQLQLDAPTRALYLHARGLTVEHGEVRAASQGRPLEATARQSGDQLLLIRFAAPVGPGAAALTLRYQGKISARDNEGLFRQKDDGTYYAYTDFEPTDARRVFPCFDEPSFKVPWQLTLRVRKEHLALANTPALGEQVEGAFKTVRFAESKPLPSYLVAFAVGPFELVEAGRAGRRQVPVRIAAPRGHGAEARYAAESTPRILGLLEDYFDSPYPYEKLDLIAVPLQRGAMENPGLVTFGQPLLLASAAEETPAQRRRFALTCAHELAHQWFGNLVTMDYWDDLWLNESFASWMETKIGQRLHPEWGLDSGQAADRSQSMGADSLVSARQIRQPIRSRDDIANAFDSITYGKGEAVLSHFERWLGEETFRRGVQRHLRDHAFGNATARDLLAALSAEAGRDVATPLSTFLDQAGVPLVTVGLRCEAGKATLQLAQRRYLPVGSPGAAPQRWQVPVCVRFQAQGQEGQQCVLLQDARAEVPLTAARGCPEWLLPNAGAAGYYRVQLEGDLLQRLLRRGGRHLSAAERTGLLGDIAALVRSGDLPVAAALALLPELQAGADRYGVQEGVALVSTLRAIVPDAELPAVSRLIRGLFGPRARSLGFAPRPGEDEDSRLLRPTLLSLVGGVAEDPALLAEGARLSRRWLDDRAALAPEVTEAALAMAARRGDRALLERYLQEARRTRSQRDRRRLLAAAGAFTEPALQAQALQVVLSDDFDIKESRAILSAALADRRTRQPAYDFLKQHFDALLRRLPEDAGAYVPGWVGGGFCDEQHRADVESFFTGRSTRYPGGPRVLAQVLERIHLCAALKDAQIQSALAVLKKYG